MTVVDDLMSLLDAGMHADHPGVIIDSDAMFGENMFGYSALRGRAAMRSRVGMFTLDIWGMHGIFLSFYLLSFLLLMIKAVSLLVAYRLTPDMLKLFAHHAKMCSLSLHLIRIK